MILSFFCLSELTNLSSWAFESPSVLRLLSLSSEDIPLGSSADGRSVVQVRGIPSKIQTAIHKSEGFPFLPGPLWQCPKSSLAFHSEQQGAVLPRQAPGSPSSGEPDEQVS